MALGSSRSTSSRQTVKLISGGVFPDLLVMARDLDPVLLKHFLMLGLKSQLELSGDVVMKQFASLGHYEGVLGVGLQLREEAVPKGVRPLQLGAVRQQPGQEC